MAFFLGIDGGGSKTDCMLGDEASVLGWGSSSSCKIARVGEEAAGAALGEAIRKACTAAGVNPTEISRTCIGVAGASRPESVAAISRVLGNMLGGSLDVVGDMEIAHHAGFGGGPGVVVISGTGSIAYGRHRSGETARAGGLGPARSDAGSGDWIGRTAVEILLLANEHGHSSALLNSVLDTWELDDVQELARVLRGSSAPDFAALFPAIAVSHDPFARRVLQRAGRELSALVSDVIGRLWPKPIPVEVAMYGGVLENSADVRDALAADLCDRCPEARVALGKRRPAEGALLLARRAGAEKSPSAASA